eukprot:180413-Hanusia_phi.AAC.1
MTVRCILNKKIKSEDGLLSELRGGGGGGDAPREKRRGERGRGAKPCSGYFSTKRIESTDSIADAKTSIKRVGEEGGDGIAGGRRSSAAVNCACRFPGRNEMERSGWGLTR